MDKTRYQIKSMNCLYVLPFILILMTGCDRADEQPNTINENDIKKISETMGHHIVDNLNSQNIILDTESFIKGIEGAKEGQEPPLSKKQFLELLASYRKKAQDLKSSENLKIAEDFLEDNKSYPGTVVIESGKLQYQTLEEGKGKQVAANGMPLIHYQGKFIDGKVFDSTEELGKPIKLSLVSTIPGFQKGIAGMKEGEKRRLFIHPDLGYGKSGHLPPNSLLIFDIEVIEAGANKSAANQKNNSNDKNTQSKADWIKKWTGAGIGSRP